MGDERRKSLAALEDEERSIRNDKNLSREERAVLLQSIWGKQLSVMGRPPGAAGKASPPAPPTKQVPIQTAEPNPPAPGTTDT